MKLTTQFFAFVVLGTFAFASVALSSEPAANKFGHYSATASSLLAVVPSTSESIFCMDSEFPVVDVDDLTIVDVKQVAATYTARLTPKVLDRLKLPRINAKCGISSVRRIELPKPSENGIAQGHFRSQRIELIAPTKAHSTESIIETARKFDNASQIVVAGMQVTRLPMTEETLFVIAIAPNSLCVANDQDFLAETILLAKAGNQSRREAHPITENRDFQIACSLLSDKSQFWGVRLFIPKAPDDPSSVRNAKNVIGIHDPMAAFASIELTESRQVSIYYSTEAKPEAARAIMDSLRESIRGSNAAFVSKEAFNRTAATITIQCEGVLPKRREAASLVFNLIAAICGQGQML